jgi:hypothetical protein
MRITWVWVNVKLIAFVGFSIAPANMSLDCNLGCGLTVPDKFFLTEVATSSAFVTSGGSFC